MAPVAAQPYPPYALTAEHVIQKSRGGRNIASNIIGACLGCNKHRPDGMSSEEYALLRYFLRHVWPPCSLPSETVRKTLGVFIRRVNAA